VYEEKIIDSIFDSHEAIIYKDDFIASIAGGNEQSESSNWLFCP